MECLPWMLVVNPRVTRRWQQAEEGFHSGSLLVVPDDTLDRAEALTDRVEQPQDAVLARPCDTNTEASLIMVERRLAKSVEKTLARPQDEAHLGPRVDQRAWIMRARCPLRCL